MKNVICNPLNISYSFQELKIRGMVRVAREAADPTLIYFHGQYLLFPSASGGFYYSSDLVNWKFKETPDWPVYDYAPDIREINGKLYFSASSHKEGTIYRTVDPMTAPLEPVSVPFKMWDPNIFQDDDGRVYFYWGCSNKMPIYGIEMNPETMMPVGEKQELIFGRPDKHGWERVGPNNNPDQYSGLQEKIMRLIIGDRPYIEGAYMNKYGNKYYLQYAAPGTELDGYGDGVYVSDKPLGPFIYQKSNPFSHKPGGFIKAAGHGSTVQDRYGNWWHIATMKISNRFNFERRLGIFPAGFDEEGTLFCNQNFGDYPMNIPDGKMNPWSDAFAGWMLLSYRKKVTVSSEAVKNTAECLVDEDIRTFWTAETAGINEWVIVDLGEVVSAYGIQLNFYEDEEITLNRRTTELRGSYPKRHIKTYAGPLQYLLEGSCDGKNWMTVEDHTEAGDDLPHAFYTIKEGIKIRYVRVSKFVMPYGGRPCMSGVRVFGKGSGRAPLKSRGEAVRTGSMSIKLTWEKHPEAVGYNIRYGNSPDKLYHSWLVYDQNELQMNCLNEGMEYFFSIDAFNENGITTGDVIKVCK